jgi:hypothetical protein
VHVYRLYYLVVPRGTCHAACLGDTSVRWISAACLATRGVSAHTAHLYRVPLHTIYTSQSSVIHKTQRS